MGDPPQTTVSKTRLSKLGVKDQDRLVAGVGGDGASAGQGQQPRVTAGQTAPARGAGQPGKGETGEVSRGDRRGRGPGKPTAWPQTPVCYPARKNPGE